MLVAAKRAASGSIAVCDLPQLAVRDAVEDDRLVHRGGDDALGGRGDGHPPACAALDQPGRLEGPHRLAHGGSGDAELLGQVVLGRQQRARRRAIPSRIRRRIVCSATR